MMSARVFQLLVLACLAAALHAGGENYNHLVITPQSPVLEIGTNFTATCMIINTSEATADDLFWNLSTTTIPKEQYTKINRSALNVTITVTSEGFEWLFCLCKKVSPYVVLNDGKFIHGIHLIKVYRLKKPENLSCIAVQEKTYISPCISCTWGAVESQSTTGPHIFYLFMSRLWIEKATSKNSSKNSAQVCPFDVFPNHMTLEIWVEAQNQLGPVESDHLKEDAGFFIKTNPPSDVKIFSEKSFPTSLLINWTQPIAKQYVRLTYEIRFCPIGSQNWTYVPLEDTAKDIQSFRLQTLQPYTEYVIQVRCKNAREGHGYWSNWSTRTTKRTPEDRPTSKPDLWMIVTKGDGMNERQVQFVCKDPVFANGRITSFDMKIQAQKDKVMNESKSIPVNRSEADSSSSQRHITVLEQIHLTDRETVKVHVTAFNSVGKSPEASLGLREKAYAFAQMEELKVVSREGQLWLEWKPPSNAHVSEYVVEWVGDGQVDWQRENRNTRHTVIKGNIMKFVCYSVSVYPIYSGWIGKPTSAEAYLEQGIPLEAPSVNCKQGRNEAKLVWEEVPRHRRQGFITNYTIIYTSGTEKHMIPVSSNTTSYTLTSLYSNTKYDIWIKASTVKGSRDGTRHSFTTLRYASGEIEVIVVGVSFGFLFLFLVIVLLCFYKMDVLKENCWPQIPNPGESTIGNWSPDCPLKAETPKENCLSGISVLDMDGYDRKSMFEEDKGDLPLKKDKYQSGEHSSGIGGSSCMSSPRQSVSDSDEGGDIADTTASTVQYSSVVASNGYKGQNPSSHPQQAMFSRSESTQPLLDSEENSDMLVQEGSRQSQRFLRQPCFTRSAGNQDSAKVLEPLDFCPLEEDSEQTTPTDGQSAPGSSYMPQLGGYRPQ
ncbi:hypothetical protein PAMP_013715 [Pampus punctatissimus]